MHRTNPLRASAAKGSSARWLARAQQDPYAASKTGGQFVSRAASKLQHMDDKYSLLPKRKPVFGVVDLGAAPGSCALRFADASSTVGDRMLIDIASNLFKGPNMSIPSSSTRIPIVTTTQH